MTLTFAGLTVQLCISEEQLGNLSVIVLSTLLGTPVRSVLVDLLSKLTIDLIHILDKKSHLRWIYVCVLIRFSHDYLIQQYN